MLVQREVAPPSAAERRAASSTSHRGEAVRGGGEPGGSVAPHRRGERLELAGERGGEGPVGRAAEAVAKRALAKAPEWRPAIVRPDASVTSADSR